MAEANPRIAYIHDVELEVKRKYNTGCKGIHTGDDDTFKQIVRLNCKLKCILYILHDIEKIDNDIAKKLFVQIRNEMRRLNKNG